MNNKKLDYDLVFELMKYFPSSFINSLNEIILHPETNIYFQLENVKNEFDLKKKVIQYVSRSACKSHPYGSEKKNNFFNKKILDSMNSYLNTEFTKEEMLKVYASFGNGCNEKKLIEFMKSIGIN